MLQQAIALYQRAAWQLAELCTIRGRLNRLQLLLRLAGLAVGLPVLLLIVAVATDQTRADPPPGATYLARLEAALAVLACFWILMAGIVRRLHDIGQSGRHGLLGLVMLPVLLWLPGQAHLNRYGLQPPPVNLRMFGGKPNDDDEGNGHDNGHGNANDNGMGKG